MTADPEQPPMMDLSAFTDPDTSWALAARGCPKAYTAIAKRQRQAPYGRPRAPDCAHDAVRVVRISHAGTARGHPP